MSSTIPSVVKCSLPKVMTLEWLCLFGAYIDAKMRKTFCALSSSDSEMQEQSETIIITMIIILARIIFFPNNVFIIINKQKTCHIIG